MKTLKRLILVLIGVGLLAFGLWLGLLLQSEYSQELNIGLVLAVGYFSSGLLANGLLLLVLVVLVFALAALWRKIRPAFGATPVARLIGLGAVVVFFSDTIGWVVTRSLKFLLSPLSSIPQKQVEFWGSSGRGSLCPPFAGDLERSGAATLGNCVGFLGQGLVDSVSSEIAAFSDALMKQPLHELLIAIALWAIIGNLVSGLLGDETPGSTTLSRYLREVSPVTWRNLALFLIVGIGGFLSVAAITAIPLLSSAEPLADLRIEELRGQLAEAASPEKFDESFPETLDLRDPLSPLAVFRSPRAEGSPGQAGERQPSAGEEAAAEEGGASRPRSSRGPSVQITEWRPDLAEDWVDFLASFEIRTQAARGELEKLWKQQRNDARGELEAVVEGTMAQVELVDLALTPQRDKLKSVAALRSSGRNRIGMLYDQVGQCRQAVEEANRNLLGAAVFVRSLAEMRVEQNQAPDDYMLGFIGWEGSQQWAADRCRRQPLGEPTVAETTPRLGVFKFVRWLIVLESLPLTLITGMLGFGLLGSAISTFVRERRVRSPGEPLVKDLTSIVLRGLSAAFVVYLAVKGGLAMFSLGGDDPNPYVLLLTCLVAAVFSEDVWRTAYEKFTGRQKETESDPPVAEEKSEERDA